MLVQKCSDQSCPYHEPLRGNFEVSTFPDPVPNEIDGALHYKEGVDPQEVYLPSILGNVEKSPHGVPFSPTAKTAKKVGFVVTCMKCEKPRLLHSERKIKKEDISSAKRMMNKITYMCGAALSEYQASRNDRDERHLKTIFVKENLSCSSKIEIPYFSVDNYPIVCIYCGIAGTHRTLNSSVEWYPKCNNCKEKPDVPRRKWKAAVEGDFSKKKNEDTALYVKE